MADLLRSLVDQDLIPELVARPWPVGAGWSGAGPAADARLAQSAESGPSAEWAESAQLDQLTRLLVAANPCEAFALLGSMQAEAGSLRNLCATVLEPAARGLGDLWATDDCSDFDVTVGLGRLQQAFRRQCLATPSLSPRLLQPRSILVVPQPGEPHLLGAVLDAELLWRAGWQVQCEFPADDTALAALVAGAWFDAVDLSLSAAFRRQHCQGRMAASVGALRAASCNPALAVVVGGRVFHDQADDGDDGFDVHADAEIATAALAVPAVGRACRRVRTALESASVTWQR